MTMLRGSLVGLRPLQVDDAEISTSWRTDRALIDEALGYPFPVSVENEKRWIESLSGDSKLQRVVFGVEQLDDGQLVGYVQLRDIDWISRCAEFGLIIGAPEARGKGRGHEVATLMIGYGFDTLNLRRLWLRIVASNEPALKLYPALGFKHEGCLREQVFRAGRYHDVNLMGLMRDDGPAATG